MLESVLKDARLTEVEEGIFTSLAPDQRESGYDTKVKAYDLVVGNALYNRVVWGNWPRAYAAFCRRALASTPGGIYLDAGCGSLVFTAEAYAQADNKLIVLFDRSLGMLRQGRERMRKARGGMPKNIAFVQGDILATPFRASAFDTVASFGVIHIFDDKLGMLAELERVKKPGGRLFFSSLVGNNRLGRKYLELLKNAGEVAESHSTQSLGALLAGAPSKYTLSSVGNMAYGESAGE